MARIRHYSKEVTGGSPLSLSILLGISSAVVDNVPLVQDSRCWPRFCVLKKFTAAMSFEPALEWFKGMRF